MSHGGARKGAGRPRKWHFDDIVRIGQACEARWREASNEARQSRRESLPHADKVRARLEAAKAIPLAERTGWLRSEAGEDHSGELEAWLHEAAGHSLTGTFEVEGEAYGGDYEGNAPRGITISTKPPRGTRMRIIEEVARRFGLLESAVNNLWQQYRRFERETSQPQDSADS
jgi:hypothetical protein